MARTAILGLALVMLNGAHAAALETVWVGPEVGAWNVAANWSTGQVPPFNTVARIDDDPGQNTRVQYTASAPHAIAVIDAGDTLAVINSTFQGGFLPVDGTISLEGNSAAINPGSLIINPGGELRMATNSPSGSTASSLFNQGDIHGGGRLTLATSGSSNPPANYNHGTIRGDNATIPLTLQLPINVNFENSGRLIATAGGRLQIQQNFSSGTPSRIVGGRIEAHPGSTVSLGTPIGYAYVEDSVLAMVEDEDPTTTAPSFLFNSELKDVTLEGNFKLTGADFAGTLTNTGEISTGASSPSPNWHNDLKGEVLLTGGGTVYLAGSFQAMFGIPFIGGGQPSGSRLVNVDNVIHGRGELLVSWLGFTNRSVVQADAGQNAELIVYNGLSPDGFVNSGVMKAINGGRLKLGYQSGSLGVMQNFEGGDAGEIIAAENSSVWLSNIHIKGGVMRSEGNSPATRGKFLAEQLVMLEGVTTEGDFRFQTLAGQLSTITLNNRVYNEGSITARFSVGATAELAGGGEIIGESGTLFSFANTTASFVNIDNLIRGSGNISGGANNRFTNRGTIRADGPITFNQLSIVNRGRIEAGPGTQVTMPFSPAVRNYDDGAPGVIHAADGGIVHITRVDGGILSTEGTGVIRANGLGINGFIKDVHNLGTLEVNFTEVQGTIVNDGIIRGTTSIAGPIARIDGTGTWEAFASLTGSLFINGPQHTIVGNSSWGASSTPSTVFINEGTLRAKEGSTFRIGTFAFENTGLVHAPAGRTISINSETTRAENSGTLQVDGNMSFDAPVGLHNMNGGTIDIRGNLTLAETVLRNRLGGSITGGGSILGPTYITTPVVVNEGNIAPGNSVGTLAIRGNFEQLVGGMLDVEITAGETLANDVLAVDGTASLAGTLRATLIGDDPLVLGDSFTLLTATEGIEGEFSELVMPALDDELFWYVQYLPTDVRATVAEVIPWDFNRSGMVDAADYVMWWKNDGGQPGYDDWAAHFGQTPDVEEPQMQAAVPEPASGLILLACGAMIFAAHRRKREVKSKK